MGTWEYVDPPRDDRGFLKLSNEGISSDGNRDVQGIENRSRELLDRYFFILPLPN